MKDFEFNWATAEMAKMYLRNSRTQERRKARKAIEEGLAGPQDVSATNVGLETAGSTAGSRSGDSDSDSDSGDDDDE